MCIKGDAMRKITMEEINKLKSESDISSLDASVVLRKYNVEDALKIYGNKNKSIVPFTKLTNCVKAGKEIHKFCKEKCQEGIKNKTILIFGDYDADGITSTTIMAKTIKELYPEIHVTAYSPEREIGYGLNTDFCKKALSMQEKNTDVLIITVDNGVTCKEQTDFCLDNNLKIIITDHHAPKKGYVPVGVTVIDPILNNDKECIELCGAGVALKLSQLLYYINNDKDISGANKYYPYAAIGTIADMMILSVDNMITIRAGLDLINNKKIDQDLKDFLNVCTSDDCITMKTIGWSIAPVLNSAGRMNNARFAIEYFNGVVDLDERKFREMNKDRKKISDDIEEKINLGKNVQKINDNFIIIDMDITKGLIGIAVNKAMAKIDSGIAISIIDNKDDCYAGSIRSSSEKADLQDILQKCEEEGIVKKFGGHKHAAGLSIYKNRFEDFKKEVAEYAINTAEEKLEGDRKDNALVGKMTLKTANTESVFNSLNLIYPEEARILIKDVEIKEISQVSKNNERNIKIAYKDNTAGKSFWLWRAKNIEEIEDIIKNKSIVDLECTIDYDITRSYVYRLDVKNIIKKK